MLTINEEVLYEYEIKKSKFIAHLINIDIFDKKLKELQSIHTKARHFVTASRFINEHDQIVESSSDDGEPKGTSGKPTLKVLQGNNLINVAIITVRYFGGTKLGTGGLVRAYSDAANLAAAKAETFEYIKSFEKELAVEYSDIKRLEYQVGLNNDVEIIDKKFESINMIVTLRGRESSVIAIAKLFIDLV